MISQSLQAFLGPVRSTDKFVTRLEDGGLYISPEQLANIEKEGLDDRCLLSICARNSLRDTNLSDDAVLEGRAQFSRLWSRSFAAWPATKLGQSAYHLMEFAFSFGLMWGAYLARREKR